MRPADDQDLPVPRLHPSPVGRARARRQRQPAAARVRAQEHRLRRGHCRLRRTRVQGDAQQRRPEVQALQAGAADERGDRLVRGHPPASLPHRCCWVWPVAGVTKAH